MPDVLTQFSTVSVDTIGRYVAQKMYTLAEQQLVLGRFATKYTLPQRSSLTIRAVRVSRLNLPTVPLTEGVAPDAVALSLTNQDVTVQQWGIVVLLTDVAEITTTHPMLRSAIERTGLAMAEMLEREMAETLLAGVTNRSYANSVADRSTLNTNNSTDNPDTNDIIAVTAALRNRGAVPMMGQNYGGTMSPQMEADFLRDTSANGFAIAIARLGDQERLDMGRIGTWQGVVWFRSNFLPRFSGVTGPGTQSAEDAGAAAGQVAGDYNANATVNYMVVARQTANDYERKISQQSATALGGGNQGYTIAMPTSTAYVYDLYTSSQADGSVSAANPLLLHSARNAASATVTVSARPTTGDSFATTDVPGDGANVVLAWVFGKDAFGRVELNGMSLRAYLTPPGASFSNPLAQGRKIGSKIMWNTWVLDGDFYEQLEATTAIAQAFPA